MTGHHLTVLPTGRTVLGELAQLWSHCLAAKKPLTETWKLHQIGSIPQPNKTHSLTHVEASHSAKALHSSPTIFTRPVPRYGPEKGSPGAPLGHAASVAPVTWTGCCWRRWSWWSHGPTWLVAGFPDIWDVYSNKIWNRNLSINIGT